MSTLNKKFLLSTLLVSTATFLSRLLGLLRSTLLSAFYGATSGEGLADAYTAAFKIPDIVFTLVISGMTSVVLIPYFLKHKSNQDELNRVVSGFINLFFLSLTVILTIVYFLVPWLMDHVLLTGWTNLELRQVAIDLTRILLLQVLLMSVSSVFGSLLNALETYKAYSLAMLFYNVGIIVGLVIFSPWWGIHGVTWGVVLGAAGHALIQMVGSIKARWRWYPTLPRWDRDLGELLVNALPRIGALTSEQLTRVILVSFGSFLTLGSLLIYDNAENLALVSHGLVAASLATTAFPVFLQNWEKKAWADLGNSLRDKMRLLILLAIPATFLPGVLRFEIPDLLMGYLRFNRTDVTLTSTTLLLLAPGALFFNISVLFVRFYYAIRQSWIPLIAAALGVGITIVVTHLSLPYLQIASLGLGRSLGWMVQASALYLFLLGNKHFHAAVTGLLRDLGLLIMIGILSAFVAEIVKIWVPSPVTDKLDSLWRLGLSSLSFILSFLGLGLFFKIPENKRLLDYLRGSNRNTPSRPLSVSK